MNGLCRHGLPGPKSVSGPKSRRSHRVRAGRGGSETTELYRVDKFHRQLRNAKQNSDRQDVADPARQGAQPGHDGGPSGRYGAVRAVQRRRFLSPLDDRHGLIDHLRGPRRATGVLTALVAAMTGPAWFLIRVDRWFQTPPARPVRPRPGRRDGRRGPWSFAASVPRRDRLGVLTHSPSFVLFSASRFPRAAPPRPARSPRRPPPLSTAGPLGDVVTDPSQHGRSSERLPRSGRTERDSDNC